MELTQEMRDYINQYPPSTQNNSRSLLRNDMLRLMKKGKVGAIIMQNKYGFEFDISVNDFADSEPVNHE